MTSVQDDEDRHLDLARPTTSSTPDTGVVLNTLLHEMRRMNQNFQTMNNSSTLLEDEDETSSETSNPEHDGSLDDLVANLAANTPPTVSAESSSILTDIARDLDAGEKTGPATSETLAKILESLLKEKLPEEKVQEKVNSYVRPENVQGLRTPRVNPLIWNQISNQSKTNDSKTQKSQQAVIAGVVAMIKATDIILKSELKDDKALITLMTDSIALTLQGNHYLNTSRRKAMKNDLNKDYAALCSSAPVDNTSEYLFGDLSKLAKDITDANKLTKKVISPSSSNQRNYRRDSRRNYNSKRTYGQNRFAPYNRGGRNDFLSKGNTTRTKKKEGNR